MDNQMYDLEELLWVIAKAKCARPGKLSEKAIKFLQDMEDVAKACELHDIEPTLSSKQEEWLDYIRERCV